MIILNELMDCGVLGGLRGVIFDCDGVMVDSLGANIWYYNAFRERFGLGPMSPDQEAYTHSHNVFDSLRRILPEEHWDQAFALRKEFDYRDMLPKIRKEPGLREALLWFRRMGFRMAVNTNRTTTMDLLLDHLDMTEFFLPVVTAAGVANPKPHPESVNVILDAWDMPPNQVAYLGDSRVDEQTACAAGVRFWSYKNEYLEAEVMVPDYGTLLWCLRRAYGG